MNSDKRFSFTNLFKNKIDFVALLITIALFGYFFLCHELVEAGDSFQYLHQYPMREPVYALLLQLFQVTCQTHMGIFFSLFQNLLAIVCIYYSYKSLSRLYNMNSLIRLATLFLMLIPHIITPLASKTHVILTCSIMTEGITFSLYYVWMTMILHILNGHPLTKNKATLFGLSFLLSLVLALTRGQMSLCIILWMVVTSYSAIRNKRFVLIILFVMISAFAFPAKSQLTKWYNLAETGYYVDTVSSKPMLLANIMYISQKDDAQYIEDDALRTAFSNILDRAQNDQLTIDYAKGGIISKALYHEACHEPLNFDYIDPEIRLVIKDKYNIDEEIFLQLMIYEDELCGQMARDLLPHVAGRYIANYINIVSLGFVRTIAIEKSFIPLMAVLLYIIAIVLMIVAFIKQGFDKAPLTMAFVLLCICGHVFGTSLVIECIGRYMIYNFPFFYMAGLVLFNSFISTPKDNELK